MKIGIEGQRLFRKKKHGMDMVALELIRNLQEIDHENEYVIFVKPDTDDTVLRQTDNFRIVHLKGGFYPFWEQFSLPGAAGKRDANYFIVPVTQRQLTPKSHWLSRFTTSFTWKAVT